MIIVKIRFVVALLSPVNWSPLIVIIMSGPWIF